MRTKSSPPSRLRPSPPRFEGPPLAPLAPALRPGATGRPPLPLAGGRFSPRLPPPRSIISRSLDASVLDGTRISMCSPVCDPPRLGFSIATGFPRVVIRYPVFICVGWAPPTKSLLVGGAHHG